MAEEKKTKDSDHAPDSSVVDLDDLHGQPWDLYRYAGLDKRWRYVDPWTREVFIFVPLEFRQHNKKVRRPK